jgi:hypothetical protein
MTLNRLVSVSNPKLQILDTLSKFSHDNDPEVALNAILAMGLAGAGRLNFIVLLYRIMTLNMTFSW